MTDKKPSRVPDDEDKHGRFRRLAHKRVAVLLKQGQLVANLARAGYEPSEAEVEHVITTCHTMARDIERAFRRQKREVTFALPD